MIFFEFEFVVVEDAKVIKVVFGETLIVYVISEVLQTAALLKLN